MKLAYIANIRLPTEKAHGAQIMNMCAAFAAAGHEVTLVVPRRRNALIADPFDFYGVPRNFAVKKLWCLDFLALPFLKRIGFMLESMCFLGALQLYALFRKTDVYYTRDLSIAAGLLTRRPLFYEIHSLPERDTWLHRRACWRASGIIVISEGLRKELIVRGATAQKVLLARDAVDIARFDVTLDRFQCRKKLGLPLDRKIIVYTGHLYGWKGADVFARAAAELPPDTLVYIVGGTDDDVRLFKQQFASANLHIVGWKNSREIPLWLKAADVLVLPTSGKETIGARYTSPMKLFEYMASGTPIVASNLPSIREVLDESRAILVAPDEPRALAEGIRRVSRDADMATVRASAARQYVSEYTWENRARRITDFINAAIK
ncbi:MAG: glycosyltransferase family 4 protein [Candidatus Harrisonbacteria bacterium]|nr:glycosyltransferase family 4 protein [Candidatus Harrisonbacteria bacterium]